MNGFALQRGDAPESTGSSCCVEHAAFALQAGESLDPAWPARDFKARFVGDIRLAKAGVYTFHVEFEGGAATIETIDPEGHGGVSGATEPPPGAVGQLVTTVGCARPATVRVIVGFERRGEERARLQLSWSLAKADSANFAREPLPTRFVTPPPELRDSCRAAEGVDAGRVALVELGCVNCHDAGAAAMALPAREPIDLTRVAARADEAWLRRWIAAPQSAQPGGGMPELIGSAQKTSDVEALLALLRATVAPAGELNPAVDPTQTAHGRELYHSLGCVACHGALASPAAAFGDETLSQELAIGRVAAPFGDLAGKWRIGELAVFLRDPLAVRKHGRMPSFGLSEPESITLAHYLAEQFGPAPRSAAAATAPAAAAPVAPPDLIERGKQRFNELGCAACHVVSSDAQVRRPEGVKSLSTLDATRGCLAESAAARGAAPRYELTAARRAELRAGLASVSAIVAAGGAMSPRTRTDDRFAALHCGACHERGDVGGVGGTGDPDGWGAYFRSRSEADLGEEGRLPPRLDGVGTKLQSPWIEQVVATGARARPYLATRMPQFGAAAATEFAHGFASAEGVWRSDDPVAVSSGALQDGAAPLGGPSVEARAVFGRQLAGSGGMNCISCHAFGARPLAGTPGLDFLQFATRVRRDWFATYAQNPLRFKPGTRMPSYFEAGRSTIATVLGGDAAAQIDALWCWFERADSMPTPSGVPTGERRLLPVGDRPVVFRTFLARAGNRGIAVGTPSGLHFAFDAEQIRLCEAWSGDFLDVAPVWEGRGGGIAVQLGPIVWSAPPGPLLTLEPALSDNGRAQGLKFLGYRLEPDGTPVFQWEVRARSVPADAPPQDDAVKVEERFIPHPSTGVLFLRKLEIRGASKERPVWLTPIGERGRIYANATVALPIADFQSQMPSGVRLDLGQKEALPLTPTEPGQPITLFIEVR